MSGPDTISACPRCGKPVEAKDFMNPAMIGMLESVLPVMHCRCGYSGLPLSFDRDDYARWMRGKRKKGK